MTLVNNQFTSDLKAAFPEDKFVMKKIGRFYILYHTLEVRNMTVGEYGKLQSILDFHSAVSGDTTMVLDEELKMEKLKAQWKEDGEFEGN